jgi:arabinose-5-phosphate isomerase
VNTSNDHDVARRVLEAESRAIAALAARLDEAFERAVSAIVACTGRVVLLGMGKSGLVCRKIAATFSSTGTPALFVHPGEAVHGDLGGIAPGDVVICASRSGETEELVRLLPVIKQVASHVIALTGGARSSLARSADSVIDTGVHEEACPLGLAPTASTTATMAMGDALAMAVLERKGFSAQDFGRFHPGGALGRQFLRVADLMKSGADLPMVAPTTPLRDVIHEISAKRIGMTTVVDGDRLVGVISDGDLRRLLERVDNPLGLSAAEVMTREPRTIPPDLLALRALEIMEAPPRRVYTLVVVGTDGALLGVLHLHDVIQVKR